MGAYKYLEELWRKKQSDIVRFIMRVRTWEYRQLPAVHRCVRSSRPDKARRIGYKAKRGYAIYRVRIRRGGRKKIAHKGCIYGKPVNGGINKQKASRTLKSIGEERAGRLCSNMRVLNSYWIGQDAAFKFYEVILVDPSHKAIRRDPRINWICSSKQNHRELRGKTATGQKARGLAQKGFRGCKKRPSKRGDWKNRNTQKFWRYRKH